MVKLYKLKFIDLEDIKYRIAYTTNSNSDNMTFQVLLRDDDDKLVALDIPKEVEEQKVESPAIAWKCHEDSVPSEVKSIKGVYLLFKNSSDTSAKINTYLGHLSIYPAVYSDMAELSIEPAVVHKLPKSLSSSQYDYYSVKLIWKSSVQDQQRHSKVLVYRGGEWIGNTSLNSFLDKEVRVKKAVTEVNYQITASNEIFQLGQPVDISVCLK